MSSNNVIDFPIFTEKWHRRFMMLADEVSTWSKDPSSQIGSVLVDQDRQVIATGYNGFPAGIADDERLEDRPIKYRLVVHAEMNCLLQAGQKAEGSVLYIYGMGGPPCVNCAKHAIAAGVELIVTRLTDSVPERWQEEFEFSNKMLAEAGVTVLQISI